MHTFRNERYVAGWGGGKAVKRIRLKLCGARHERDGIHTRCDICLWAENTASRDLSLAASGLPAAGDLAAVAAEGELLDQIGYGLADGSEPYLHMAVRCDVRHTSGQP